MRVYLDNCCYNRPFDDQHNRRESADYTEWRQNQFDDLKIEELGRATRESGKRKVKMQDKVTTKTMASKAQSCNLSPRGVETD